MDEEDLRYTSIWSWLSPARRWVDWQRRHYNRMRRRRAWRLFDAACASVRVLADHVHTGAPTSGLDAAWAPAATKATTPAPGFFRPAPALPAPPSSPPTDGGDPGASDGQSPPTDPAEDQKLTRDEAAILSAITEKFYKTWTFRIIGLALVAAAFLAGAGTLFLGEHTLSLREDLEKVGKKGEDEIKSHTETAQKSIDKQMVALTRISHSL